ncbi:MAG: copper amine oxidase [Acidimicrobiales bacterium]
MSATTRQRLRSAGTLLAIVLLGAAVPVAVNVAADANGAFNCAAGFQVDETLTNGARWQMCWEKRAREGIVIHDVTYTPIGGQPVEVLSEAALAQIHVPYDDNGARFHDLSDFGLGGNMDALSAGDCPNGTLLSSNWICQTEAPTGYAYKSYDEVADATSLNLFSASCIGAYCYVVAWNFDDDGTIRPEVGATGTLQRYGGTPQSSWPMGGGRRAVAHMHNFYWRLDFDVDGAANDRVEELEARFAPGTGRQQLNNSRQAFSAEVARRVAAGGFRSWRVRDTIAMNGDNHPISFELLPNADNIFRGPSYEAFTQNELYVTRNRACERFASHNPTAGGCPSSLAGFADGQSLTGQDLVVWYGTSFHHLPRDEDEEHMHPHWSGFSIVPRDLTATNPAG